jgi:hypothetical protein
MKNNTSELVKKLVNYLDWSHQQTFNLAKKINLPKDSQVQRGLDVPTLFLTEEKVENFTELLNKTGYTGFHIGITRLWSGEESDLVSILFDRSRCVAAHGTSIKKSIKEHLAYEKLLIADRNAIDLFDSSESIPVNYDLFGGNLLHPNLVDNFSQAGKENYNLLSQKILGYQSLEVFELYSFIIKSVAKVYKRSKRKIFFEIPGTKGWSLFPSTHFIEWEKIIHLIDMLFPTASLCIDLGHLLTWQTTANDIKLYIQLIKQFSNHVDMVHLSSAGSRQAYFQEAYTSYYQDSFPDWHLNGLDLMLPIIEPEIVNMVSEIRKIGFSNVIEISETRTDDVAIADYFPNLKLPFDNRYILDTYSALVKEQAKILGYI